MAMAQASLCKIWWRFAKQLLNYGSECACTARSMSLIKVICKGHKFVESVLLLLSKHKKFEDDAIAEPPPPPQK